MRTGTLLTLVVVSCGVFGYCAEGETPAQSDGADPGEAGSIVCLRSNWREDHDRIEAMSPDGSQSVVLLALICGGWASDADGSNLRQIIRSSPGGGPERTSLDLEGRLLTSGFYDRSGRFHDQLSAIDVETGEVTELDLSDSARIELLALRPVCSRDNSKVAFHRAGDI